MNADMGSPARRLEGRELPNILSCKKYLLNKIKNEEYIPNEEGKWGGEGLSLGERGEKTAKSELVHHRGTSTIEGPFRTGAGKSTAAGRHKQNSRRRTDLPKEAITCEIVVIVGSWLSPSSRQIRPAWQKRGPAAVHSPAWLYYRGNWLDGPCF